MSGLRIILNNVVKMPSDRKVDLRGIVQIGRPRLIEYCQPIEPFSAKMEQNVGT